MKANEAPEKIYLVEDRQKHEPMEYWYNSTTDDSKIEYVRTDALIEKTCEFFYEQLNNGTMECGNIKEFIEDFKKYMNEDS